MSLAADVEAVRTSVTFTDADHVACIRIDGDEAHELLDRVSPRQLFVRTGQMLHTLLLDETAKPLADVYVCCDDDYYLVLAEGMSGPDLVTYLGAHSDGLDAAVVDLSESHGLVSLDGPYAWELLSEVSSPDVIGLPYLSFFHDSEFSCFRGGKTGEFGYDLLVERARLPEVRDAVLTAGEPFGIRRVGLDALELCILEAGFFNVRREVRDGLTPIELQLQWRVSFGRQYPGSEALESRRAEPRGRATHVTSDAEIAIDQTITLDGNTVGVVLNAGWSYTRDEWLGVAMLDRSVAYAGISGFTCGAASLRTVSAPAVNNRSLYIDPQRHSQATRDTDEFPPLVRPSWS